MPEARSIQELKLLPALPNGEKWLEMGLIVWIENLRVFEIFKSLHLKLRTKKNKGYLVWCFWFSLGGEFQRLEVAVTGQTMHTHPRLPALWVRPGQGVMQHPLLRGCCPVMPLALWDD